MRRARRRCLRLRGVGGGGPNSGRGCCGGRIVPRRDEVAMCSGVLTRRVTLCLAGEAEIGAIDGDDTCAPIMG